jgi:hypothetical protein
LKVVYESKEKKEELEWQIFKTAYNETYIYCEETKSTAYYNSDDAIFNFKNFYGKNKSIMLLLFKYLYSVKKTYYKDIKHKSAIRPDLFFKKSLLLLQDFFAPFYLFLKTKYTLYYIEKDDDFSPDFIKLKSNIEKSVFGKKQNETSADILLKQNGEIILNIKEKGNEIKLSIIQNFYNNSEYR